MDPNPSGRGETTGLQQRGRVRSRRNRFPGGLPGRGVALFVGLILPSGGGSAQELVLEPYTFVSQAGDSVQAEWGRLTVPAIRGRPEAGTLELSFVRFPTTSPDPGPPILYLSGGPGSSGIGAARGPRFPLFMAMRELGDVITLDQRGANASNPVGDEQDECEVYLPRPLDRPLDNDTLVELSLEAASQCADRWRKMGIVLEAYNTVENASDIADLSRALGAPRVRLWAISYGTHLALTLLRSHPEVIDRVILAGTEGPDHTVKLPEISERQLHSLQALARADSELAARFPDVVELVESVLERLEREPVTLEFEPPDGGEGTQVVVGAPELRRLTISLLRDPYNMVAVPSLYARVAGGDFSDFPASPRVRFEYESMPEAMDAASGMSAERMARFRSQDETTLLGGGSHLDAALMADALSVPDLGDDFRAAVETDVPALFISGTLDGRTPVANAEEVMEGFSDARHLVIENAGHSNALFLSSPEILPAMLDFMRGRPAEDRHLVVSPPTFAGLPDPTPIEPTIAGQLVGEYERGPGDIWRILPMGTIRSRASDGTLLVEDAKLQIRFDGNGFPLRSSSDGAFYIDFPGLRSRRISFVRENDRVVALTFPTRSGEIESMPKRP